MGARRWIVRGCFLLLAIAAVGFGTHGVHRYAATVTPKGDTGALSVLAGTAGLFIGEGLEATSPDLPMSLDFARLAAPLVTAFATFELFRTKAERAFRKACARRRKGHVVLVGLGASGRLIAEQLMLQGERCVVAIDEKGGATAASMFDRPRWAVIDGSGTHADVLEAAGAPNAAMVHIATGQDGVDMDIAATLRSLGLQRELPDPLEVKVQLESPTLCRRLQQQELERADSEPVLIEYVNLTALAAAAILEFITIELAEAKGQPIGACVASQLRLVGDTRLLRGQRALFS